ncbi:hypothetical protein [Metabacillus fastidiosus]|uniref:hypothetical protein n=1 Tax=Metabacillus fastidiosus TaxID=1458 RepID=UPI002E1B3B43|nr:hypothetical protein [Metabacillus fastidiosus]
MKQFVFLIDTGNETSEHKIHATGMTDALKRVQDLKNHLNDNSNLDLKIKFKGIIYENAF